MPKQKSVEMVAFDSACKNMSRLLCLHGYKPLTKTRIKNLYLKQARMKLAKEKMK